MDPNENLRELLLIAKQVISASDEEIAHYDISDRMAELIVSLDGWLSGGGFLPERWVRK